MGEGSDAFADGRKLTAPSTLIQYRPLGWEEKGDVYAVGWEASAGAGQAHFNNRHPQVHHQDARRKLRPL